MIDNPEIPSIMTIKPVRAGYAEIDESPKRLNQSFGLMGAIWLLGLIGYLTPLTEWPALWLYVLGSITLVFYRGYGRGEWNEMFMGREGLSKSLKWGGIAGIFLFVMDITNTWLYYSNGGKPMIEMEMILVGKSLLLLFPLLVLAEEFLWRGIMFSAMLQQGYNKHLVVVLTTLFYVVNHFAVAPVGLFERALMAMMAFPIGIIGGYIVLRSQNVWGSVLLHMLTMGSMMLDIFVIPKLIFG